MIILRNKKCNNIIATSYAFLIIIFLIGVTNSLKEFGTDFIGQIVILLIFLIFFEYYKSGLVKIEANFRDGKKHGKFAEYYESGTVLSEGNYVNGKKEGKWFSYDEEGHITDEDIWKDGECVEMCEGIEKEDE